MSSGRHTENNVKAGLFVLVALIAGLAVIFILGDIWARVFGPPMTAYHATFTVQDGVGFLQPGSEVRLGGLAVGEVDTVALDETQDPVRTITISFQIPTDVTIYSNAVATVQSGLISAESFVQISSVGWDEAHRTAADTGLAGTPLKEDDVIAGTPSSGMLGSMLGPETGLALSSTIRSIDEITSGLRQDGRVLEWVLGEPDAASLAAGAGTLGDVFQRMGTDGYAIEWVLGEGSASDHPAHSRMPKRSWPRCVRIGSEPMVCPDGLRKSARFLTRVKPLASRYRPFATSSWRTRPLSRRCPTICRRRWRMQGLWCLT